MLAIAPALALFAAPGHQAAAGLPPGGPAAREACKAALAREEAGRPGASSREPCHSAFLLGGQPEDLRNEVASMMSPARHPTLDDLAIAALMAEAAGKQNTFLPWGYLARCDIARRLGNADALKICLDDLRKITPNHPATKWALAVSAEHTSPWIWMLRGLGLVFLLGTGLHAALRLRGRRRAPPLVAAAVGALLLLGAGLGPSRARAEEMPTGDHLSFFKIDDADPEASVPPVEEQTKKPLEFGYFLQDLAAKAEKASKRGDHAAAARYYGALTKAAPTVAYGPRQMCRELEAAGDLPTAIKACRTAITGLGATTDDFTRFISLVLASKGPLPPEERTELEMVVAHLGKEGQLGALPTMLRCDIDLRFKDYAALEACTQELARRAPQDPKTISLQWALALHNHDRGQALALIDRARSVGMNGEGLARMEQATRAMTLRRAGFLFALVFLLAAGAFALVRFRREIGRRRLAV